MSDRYSDRHDYYNDEDYDRYADPSRYRSSRSSSGAGAYADNRRRTNSGNLSDGYASGSSSYGSRSDRRASQADAAAYRRDNSGRRQHGSESRQRGVDPYQQAGSRQSKNLFEGYYPEDTADTYRRSAYGSGSSRPASSYRPQGASHSAGRAAGYSAAQADSFVPAQPQRGGRGSHAQGYSRADSDGAYAPKRSNLKRNIIIAAVVIVAVVLVGAGAAWAYVHSIEENLHKGVDQEMLDALEPAEGQTTETALADAPFYMLLLGTDTSADRVETQAEYADGNARSDSMILARIDPINKKAALISIHRDTMVDMGEYGQQKINAAYQYWGPAGAIQAVSTMAGVPISHYASVDFDGFREIVNALGGVEVNVPMEINDEVIPAHIDAGWQTLDGTQALDLCRARHAYDDVADDGDVMRAANQRMVISAIAKKILASDVMTIASTVSTMSKYATTDLNVSDIIGLAQIFQGCDPASDIYTAMEPTTSAYIDETWYEFLNEAEWKEMISRMDKGLPPVNKTEIDERTGTVLSTGGSDAPVV